MANITGNTGADTLVGSTGVDSIVGFAGADSITAGTGNDSVYGGNGNDTVTAADGNDLIYGDRDLAQTWGFRVYDRDFSSAAGQAPSIDSGTLRGSGLTTGFDVAALVNAARGTTGNPGDFGVIFVSTFTATVAGTYRFTTTSDDGSTIRLLNAAGTPLNFANQTGGILPYLNNDFHRPAATEFGDVVLAAGQTYAIEVRYWENQGQNVLSGTVTPPGGTAVDLASSSFIGNATNTNTGNDLLQGGAGLDTIFGEAGDDTLTGGTGADSLDGGNGNDNLSGDDDTDVLRGGAGADTLSGDAGDDSLFGGDGNDLLNGGAANDTLTGDAGADTLIGGADRDLFFGGFSDAIDGSEAGDDFDTLDLRAYGKTRTDVLFGGGNNESGSVNIYDVSNNLIGTLTFANIENIIPCFTPGTRIATDRGDVPVEYLRPGDLVVTRDNGLQPLRWVGRRDLDKDDLQANPALQPILIRKGTLAPCQPVRDMQVSPQHRMLVANAFAEMLFGEEEVLVAAVHMLGLPGVARQAAQAVSYIHIMCDAHQIILADGAWSESFQPAGRMVQAMPSAQQAELLALFPDLCMQPSFPAARRSLKAHEARVLMAAS